MRLHVVRHVHRSGRVHVDGDFPVQIQPGELVPLRLRNRQAVSDEDHGRFDRAIQLAACAQYRVLTRRQRLFNTASQQRQLRLLRDQDTRLEFHRLPVPGNAPGPQPDLLELPFDVGGGLLERGAADIAPFERVVGQELDVAPPPFAFGGGGLEDKGGHGYQQVSQLHACALDGCSGFRWTFPVHHRTDASGYSRATARTSSPSPARPAPRAPP